MCIGNYYYIYTIINSFKGKDLVIVAMHLMTENYFLKHIFFSIKIDRKTGMIYYKLLITTIFKNFKQLKNNKFHIPIFFSPTPSQYFTDCEVSD